MESRSSAGSIDKSPFPELQRHGLVRLQHHIVDETGGANVRSHGDERTLCDALHDFQSVGIHNLEIVQPDRSFLLQDLLDRLR